MEKELFGDFNIGNASRADVGSNVDIDDVKKEEERLKRNSTSFLVLGALTLLGGAAFLGVTTGWIASNIPGLLAISLGLGIGAAALGGLSVLRNIFRKGSLEFPKLKMLRKSPENMSGGTAYRPFEETTFASRKLSKSDDKVFFGVCSGLAEFAGVSPGLMRMAFVMAFLFSGGAMIFPYLVLAFALPAIRRNNPA